ncbi:hypothetical protein PIIN_08909 [Serendipita indica DSM 11827]|uniref:DUF7918 domain-containing protein n=1 Tax=Serendipita indica (strain DSM 11827) TaxID=1109443 RepID=G4U357_SERID|nr:hypothetical protein PIIN_08909 [Serendipita indica DSM 11827]
MPALNGFDIRVICEGSALEEYSTYVDPSAPNDIACWIPSTAGQNFRIQYTWDVVEDCHWSIELRCDGKRMRNSSVPSYVRTFAHKGARSGDEIRVLTFAPLLLTEDENVPESKYDAKIGTICIKIWRSRPRVDNVPVKGPHKSKPRQRLFEETPVFEGKKTIGVHRTKVGELLAVRPKQESKSVYMDRQPYLTVTFRYRSPDMLRAMGVMPPLLERKSLVKRSSTPTVVKRSASYLPGGPHDEDERSSEEEELVAKVNVLNSRIKTLQNKKHKPKREASPIIGVAGPSRTVKGSSITLDHEEIVELSSD